MSPHPFRLREIPIATLTGSVLLALMMRPAAALDDVGSVQNPTTLNKVSVTAQTVTSKVPTQAEQFRSAQTRKIIAGKQLQSVSAGAGAAQALEVAPGVHVNGYGSGSTTRYSISINGIKQGWGGEPSGAGIDYGSIGVTFDGIPMNNPGTGLWQTTLVNQLLLIEGIGVTYGPGDPRERGFTDIGGRIDFLPVQPAAEADATARVSVGSHTTRGAAALLQSGARDGYSAVLGAGYTYADSFRQSSDGFNNNTHASMFYAKLRKTFSVGDVSVGAYAADAQGYRPTAIPVAPIADLTVNGLDPNGNVIPGPLYSQPTTGYYSALPRSVWFKKSTNHDWLVYSKANLDLDATTTLHNRVWFNHENRLHDHYNDFVQNPANLYEYNNPFSREFGDKLYADIRLPGNTLSTGVWYIDSTYDTRQAFYNPNAPYFGSRQAPNAKYRDDYWYQDKAAAFVQDKIALGDAFYLLPGLRAIRYATDYVNGGAARFPDATGKNQGQLPNARNSFSKLEPSLDAHWTLTPSVALYANYAQAYKEPQNGGGGGPYQSIEASSIQLERGHELQGGVKWHVADGGYLHHFLLEANLYQLDFGNQIIGHTLANGDTISAFGSSVYRGVNLSVADSPLQNLYLFANLSREQAHFSHYQPDGGPDYSGLAVAYVPDTTLNLGGYYDLRLGSVDAEPRLTVQYTGKQHMFDDVLNATSSRFVPSYTVVDAGVKFDLPSALGLHGLELGVNVDNLFDRKYNPFEWISAGGYFGTPDSVGAVLAYPAAGRSYFVTLSAHI